MWKSPTYVVAGLLCAAELITGMTTDVQFVETFLSCLTSNSLDMLTPASQGWIEATTPFNLRLRGHFIPSAIVYPISASGVSSAILCANKYDARVSPISGGHSYSASGYGFTNGTLVVNMSSLKHVSVDRSSGLAKVQSGIKLGDMALEIYKRAGRALAHGTDPQVGVGGQTSFGGYGFVSRKWGLLLDQVVEAEVVLASGSIVNASATENTELFWAIRGAGPSFGIITQWTYQTHEAPTNVVGFNYTYSTPNSSEFSRLLSVYTAWALDSAPPEIGLEADIVNGPAGVSFVGMYEGQRDVFDSLMRPVLNSLGAPLLASVSNYGWIKALEWIGSVSTLATEGVLPEHNTFLAKSLITPLAAPLTMNVYTAWGEYLFANTELSSKFSWFMQIELYGGTHSAINAPMWNATAYPFRDCLFMIQLYAATISGEPPYPFEAGYSFLESVINIIQDEMPGVEFGAYTNYMDPTLKDWQDRYYKDDYSRLSELQKRYDPCDRFLKHQGVGSV